MLTDPVSQEFEQNITRMACLCPTGSRVSAGKTQHLAADTAGDSFTRIHVCCLGRNDQKPGLHRHTHTWSLHVTWAPHSMAAGLFRGMAQEGAFQANQAKTAWPLMTQPWGLHCVTSVLPPYSMAQNMTRLPRVKRWGHRIHLMMRECPQMCGRFWKPPHTPIEFLLLTATGSGATEKEKQKAYWGSEGRGSPLPSFSNNSLSQL